MFLQAIGIGLVGTIVVVVLRQVKPELAIFAGTCTGVAIVLLVTTSISELFSSVSGLTSSSSVSSGIMEYIIKIIGIGYITEYASGISEDYGSKSIGKNIQLAGKVAILILALPIISSIIEAISAIL